MFECGGKDRMQGRDSQDALELAAVAGQDNEVCAREVAVESLVGCAMGDDLLRWRCVIHVP